MQALKIPGEALVLVCDGAKALLFRNAGDEAHLDLRTMEVHVEPHPPTRELGTDRAGRAFASVGNARSGQETTDFHDAAEAAFVAAALADVERVARDTQVRHLVVVAPPRALAVIRRKMSDHLRELVLAEIDKDLTKMTTPDIERHLVELARIH